MHWAQESMPFFMKLLKLYKKLKKMGARRCYEFRNQILLLHYDEADFDKFSKIAPVLVIPEGDMDSLERIKVIGEATGRKAEAEKAVSNF